MSGLYQRALAYIRTQSVPTRPREPAGGGGQRISAADREKVLGQINEIVARNRIQVTPETLSFTPKQGGGLLPLLINAGAAVVLIGGILTAVLLFRRQEQTIVTAPTSLETAEGRLVQALREESERELSRKQQEINEIQSRLQRINQEKTQLQEESEDRLRERERELRDALSRELEAERARLRSAGMSNERITAQLEEMASQRSQSLQTELATFRGQLEAELSQREATLNNLIGEYEQNLKLAEQESARLEQELAARQAELEAQYRAQETALQADRTRALEQLERLREQQEKEQLIRDQFLSFYTRTQNDLEARRFPEALATLQEFRAFLDQPSLNALPGIRERRPVERFLIDSLEQLITQEQKSSEADTGSLIASANLIARVSEMVDRADRLFQDRDYQKARELYLSALAEIPAVELGYERLQAIESVFARRREEQVAALITAAGSAYREGDYQTAVGGYSRALTILQGQRAVAEEMVARIMDAGYRIHSAAEVRKTEGGSAADERLAALAEADKLLTRLEASEQTARQRAEELEAARRRIAELEAGQAESQARQSDLETARSRIAELEAAQAQAQARRSDLETARGRIAELEAARSAAERRVAELEATVQRLTASQASQAELARLTSDLEAAKNRIRDLESARTAAQQRIGELEAAASEAGKRAEELQEARRRIAELESDRRQRQETVAQMERVRQQYLALRSPGTDSGTSPKGLVALLETKVLIQRVLISEPVRSQYPELYDRFEEYLEALVQEQEQTTQVAVLQDVEALLDSLLQKENRQVPLAPLRPYRAAPASEPFLRVLEKLELLLR